MSPGVRRLPCGPFELGVCWGPTSPLRTQFIGLLTLRGYTQRTHESYIRAVAALSRHYGLPPDRLSDGQIRDYLIGLHQRGLSRSTINVAISALRLTGFDIVRTGGAGTLLRAMAGGGIMRERAMAMGKPSPLP